jgi:hypothetical protein
MMAMAVPKKTMAKMTMAMPVMAVASTMPTVTAMASRESLARDSQRSRGQRQRSDCGRSDLLDLRHGRLLGWAERGSLRDDPPLEALAAMRCDQDHPTGGITPIGMIWRVRYLPHAWRDYLSDLA